MKDFKRKASSSSIEKLKTHPKFPLIETFLETLTSSSREVQHIMIFAKCLINIYLVLVNASLSLFKRGVQELRGMELYRMNGLSSSRAVPHILTNIYFNHVEILTRSKV